MTASSFDPEFKARLVIEILMGEIDVKQASLEYGIEPREIEQWKEELLAKAPLLFEQPGKPSQDQVNRLAELEQRAEKLSTELALVKQIIEHIKTLDEINQDKLSKE